MKINLPFLQSGYRSSNALNTALQRIISAFDNTLSRDGTGPNEMLAPLDMNSNRIINLGAPVGESDAVRLQDIVNMGGGTIDLAGKANTDASNVGVYRSNWLQEIGAASVNASNLTPANVADWAAKLGLDPKNRGFWNADTNVPELVSGVGQEGEYYRVSVDGATDLDGIDDWVQGDTVVFSDGAWIKVQGSDALPDSTYVYIEDHGGKANDPLVDNAIAAATAEAWIAAKTLEEPGFRGILRWRSGVDYYFKNTLLMNRMGGGWVGDRTRLIYNGASTTKDLVVLGHYNGGEALAGKPQIRDVIFRGFQIISLTKMTAGWAFRTRSCIESNFELELQTQFGFETYGHNLWNGIWNEWSSTVTYKGTTWVAQNIVSAINGAPGTSGGKSDCWVDVGKIAGGQLGTLVGGGFGGVWFSTRTTFIANRVHGREDQSLTAENNREVMWKGCTLDYTDDISIAALGGSVGVDIVGPGECFHDFTDCWIAGAHGTHIIIRATSSAFVNITGNRFFFGKPHPSDGTLTGHAVVVDSNTARVNIVGGQMNSFPGIPIVPRIASHCVNYADIMAWNCPLGLYDPTFAPTADTSYRVQSGFTVGRSGMFSSNMIIGEPGDTLFQMNRADGVSKNPLIQFDSNDYIKYLKSTNVMEFKAGGAVNTLSLNAGGLSILDQPYIAYQLYTGTVAVSGEGGQIHGISSLASRAVMAMAYVTQAGGDIKPHLVSIDNSYAGFTGATPSRPYRMFIIYLKDAI